MEIMNLVDINLAGLDSLYMPCKEAQWKLWNVQYIRSGMT